MKAKLITVDGVTRNIIITSFVGARNLICLEGYSSPIEIVNLNNGYLILLDEEGKLKNLSMNQTATEMAHEFEAIYPSDYICGDVILIEDAGEFDDLPYDIK